MKFQLAVNLRAHGPQRRYATGGAPHALRWCNCAELGGFSTVWAAEHHAHEK